ncbi:MAG: hypothetical protein GY803_03100 [Chloroflexi bacterium]|nr:hypothetical protein [Chloroflexota bacterium]
MINDKALEQLRRRQRDATEQILTDGRLRDGLTDEQATGLLDWALAVINAKSSATATMPGDEADGFMDELVTAVHRTTRRANLLINDLAGLGDDEAKYQTGKFLDGLSKLVAVSVQARSDLLSPDRFGWDKTAVFRRLMSILAYEEEE